MFERILLPLDGSEMAEMALPYGEELARNLGSALILLHVGGPEHKPEYDHIHKIYLERLAEAMEHNISDDQPGRKITIEVETGEPSLNICNLVEKNKVDLVIMAAVSASGLKIGKMLGSVADQVCRVVPVPVMLIRPQHIKPIDPQNRLINRILLPVDGSDLSKLALLVGAELAAKLKSNITLFQMATKNRPYYGVSIGGAYSVVDYAQLDEIEEKRVQAEMIALEKELKEKGLAVTSVVTSGFDAAGAIIDTVKKVDADLVVMSTHGRSGLGRWVFGNVAEKVLRHGESPVLLIRARAG